MNGQVDDAGRALIVLKARAAEDKGPADLTAWIDTAFTGELVVPRATISALSLAQSASVLARLADGTQVVLESYSCIVEWFGVERVVEVVENDGQFALLGVGLLRDHRVEINYPSRSVFIE